MAPAWKRASLAGSEELRGRVSAELHERRADDAVLKTFPGFSRQEVRQLFEDGRVRADGKRLKKGERVQRGQELAVDAPSAPIAPDASIPLQVLFESADYVIADKPAGLPTAPLARTQNRSLAAALLARYPELLGVGFRPREPGLVHRLDTETSGVVLAARSEEAFRAARAAFESHGFEKRYLAVTLNGVPQAGIIETVLGPDSADPRRVRAFLEPPEGYSKACVTRYRALERGARFTLVELSVERAFRHQIRAHLAHIGFPIAGDALYGGPPAPELLARHALHGSYIAWAGDARRAGFRAEAALPAELRALVGGAAG
ncbi:MAG: RluA family pseudouridine synthase [Myxococcales bacterium]|nr:MAG: RluA family pseudouridine synthase [Myxococcales bacterium]